MQKEFSQIGQWNSFDELKSIQENRLPYMLNYVEKSPFYKKMIKSIRNIRSVDELTTLPLTTKNDLQRSYPFGMLAVPRVQIATYHESSGTSAGPPTPSYFSDGEWVELMDRYARKAVPISSADTLMVRTPYAFGLAGNLAHQTGRMKGAAIIPGDSRSLVVPYSRVIRALHDLDVTLTWSTPSECLVWAAAAQIAGYEPLRDFPALRAFYVGGEPLSPARRDRIRKLWGIPVVDEYGCTEVGSIAGTCPAGHTHIWSDRLVTEVYDPSSGKTSRDGIGRLVITPLYREGMPLLRYLLGDLVEIEYGECQCGWILPKIKVFGRDFQIFTIAGKNITQYQLEEFIYELPEIYGVMFWRAQAEFDCLIIEIEVDQHNGNAAINELTKNLNSRMEIPCRVNAVSPGTLVPEKIISSKLDAVKPRKLFSKDENWDAAILRC